LCSTAAAAPLSSTAPGALAHTMGSCGQPVVVQDAIEQPERMHTGPGPAQGAAAAAKGSTAPPAGAPVPARAPGLDLVWYLVLGVSNSSQ
jgi:hypothetical protein